MNMAQSTGERLAFSWEGIKGTPSLETAFKSIFESMIYFEMARRVGLEMSISANEFRITASVCMFN